FSLVILFFWCLSSADSNIPNQPCKVYFRDKRIIISEPASGGGYGKEKEYSIKGVCYQSIPVGSDWDYFNTASDPEKRAVYERDFALLADAGFNTIRTWTEVNQTLLDLAYRYKIKVCLGFFVDYKSDLSNPAVRNEIKTRFTSYVTSFKNHPAVLFWMLGNEQNLTNGNNSSWYTLANELGGIAHSLEGAYRHPVAIVEGDLGNIGNSGRHANDSALSNIDLWASNVYRGKSFGSLFSDYKARSNKPLMISEYGVDAYDSRKGQEDEMTQMLWDRALWQEIASNNDVCVGATVMDYSDGWCKITPYLPTGYMGDFGNISMDDKFPQDNPSLGTKCIKFAYSGVAWAGVYWLFPADNWGNLGPGLDLSDYTKLRFWIKGNNGGEQVGFKLTGNSATICLTNEGGQDGSRICLPDDPPPYFALSPDWKEHVFDLKGYNLSNIR
ncbi:MAG: hypothetical protein NT033_09990, partial [Candidatus Omnitrophica bacterium]|nr:hypothetical protein [Candidatus Omnitrophota bacterium]